MCAPVAHPCRMSPVDLRWELKPWLKSLKLKSFSWGKSWKGLVLVGCLCPEVGRLSRAARAVFPILPHQPVAEEQSAWSDVC